jgi:hypothetical protein
VFVKNPDPLLLLGPPIDGRPAYALLRRATDAGGCDIGIMDFRTLLRFTVDPPPDSKRFPPIDARMPPLLIPPVRGGAIDMRAPVLGRFIADAGCGMPLPYMPRS